MRRLLLALVLLAGCKADDAATRPARPPPATAPAVDGGAGPRVLQPIADPLDAQPVDRKVYQLDVYHLRLPQGALSLNAEFWKKLDEQALGFVTHELLGRNGLRAGVGRRGDLADLAPMLEGAAVKRSSLLGVAQRDMEIPLRTDVQGQTLFVYDAAGQLVGKDYDQCDNLVQLSYQQAPRAPDRVRLALAPTVRSDRVRVEFGERGEARDVRFFKPETLYDVGVRYDLPLDGFLILAASGTRQRTTSVGSAFFIDEGGAERLERALVIVPTARGVVSEDDAAGE